MNKGRWAIVVVLLVATGMGIATWPLMHLRRRNEIFKTEALIGQLRAACRAYKARNGDFPGTLADLEPSRAEPRDAWGRPFSYNPLWKYGLPPEAAGAKGDDVLPEIRSLGPDENDPSDDLPRGSSDPRALKAPSSRGSSSMD